MRSRVVSEDASRSPEPARARSTGARAAAARRTRLAVIQAAADLFSEEGYGRTSLRAIAERAGVSVETVGLIGPKRQLLRWAFDMAWAGSGDAYPASGEPAYEELTRTYGLAGAVPAYARLLAASIARTAGLWRALQAAADADPAAARSFEELRTVRRAEFERTARWLVELGAAPSTHVGFLVEQFFLLASHETYLLLRDECAMTPWEFGDRLAREAAVLLAGDAGDPLPRG